MAYKTVEGRSAGKRSRPSDVVSRQIDTSEIALSPPEIQTARLRKRYDFSPSLAAAIAELAFASSDSWRATR